MTGAFTVEPLGPSHPRKDFRCGTAALDRYLHEFAGQDARRRVSNCFVAVDGSGVVAAFYTLAAASLPLVDLPETDRKRLPRYGVLPAGLIGRLAVDQRFTSRGLGGALVLDATRRSAAADPAIFALIVDAKDEVAAGFYAHLGFTRFASRPLSLFLPITTALAALA